MGKGKRTYRRSLRQTLAIALVTSAATVSLIAPAVGASPGQNPSQNSTPPSADELIWLKSAGLVKTASSQSVQQPVSNVTYTYPSRRHTPVLQKFVQGDGRQRWYAMVGAGSSAVALLPGAVIEPEGFRLQKRAKIGAVQLGIARDIGGGRVTLGYLRNVTARDRLVPYYTRKTRQNLAALTLTFKH